MRKERKLGEIGIREIQPIEENIREIITREVCKKIYSQFLEYKIDYHEIYQIISTTPMSIAEIKEGLSTVNYYNQTETIYFSNEKNILEIDEYTIHECIHRIQDYKNKTKKLNQMGLSTLYETKIEGVALNEAAIQYITSIIMGEKRKKVEVYDLEITTISPTYYPLLTNLIEQMVFTTGMEVLIESIFNNNNKFMYEFIFRCGEDNFYNIQKEFDNILSLKNDLLENEVQDIQQTQEQIKDIYCQIQKEIYINYFEKYIKRINKVEEIHECRRKLFEYRELIGTNKEQEEYDYFCLEEQFKLEDKGKSLSNKLMVISNNPIARIFRSLKKFFANFINK